MADTLPTSFQLTVVTRERRIIDVESDEVELPASDGEIGVLPGHTPLLTTLRVGTMRYRSGGEFHRIVISWGFAEILPDRVIVLAERGVLPSEVDPAAAEAERIEAEKARSGIRHRRGASRRSSSDDQRSSLMCHPERSEGAGRRRGAMRAAPIRTDPSLRSG